MRLSATLRMYSLRMTVAGMDEHGSSDVPGHTEQSMCSCPQRTSRMLRIRAERRLRMRLSRAFTLLAAWQTPLRPGLLVGQAAGGMTQEMTLPGQGLQQIATFAGPGFGCAHWHLLSLDLSGTQNGTATG